MDSCYLGEAAPTAATPPRDADRFGDSTAAPPPIASHHFSVDAPLRAVYFE